MSRPISEKDIYISANFVISRYKENASKHALKMIEDFRAKGAEEAANVWVLISQAIESLQNTTPPNSTH